MEEDSNKTLFVFYRFENNDKNKNWSYSKFPGNWRWVGSGSTSISTYPREEQFVGDKKYLGPMKELLQRKMDSLKRDDIIKNYKIRERYNP